ncbi:hypothetical protein NDU88_004425 [Pleurodeles waltl]|uniref:Uncharacterized protein n=1 Tax=Pleurodeles waltl TaxID=8319 RepID=A0AAV7T849_PLEWA|nr:hypothetical protein NDU88_004425 [Pleurodeles waltl]
MKAVGLLLLICLISAFAGEAESLWCRNKVVCVRAPCPSNMERCKAGEVCYSKGDQFSGCLSKQMCLDLQSKPNSNVRCCETSHCT